MTLAIMMVTYPLQCSGSTEKKKVLLEMLFLFKNVSFYRWQASSNLKPFLKNVDYYQHKRCTHVNMQLNKLLLRKPLCNYRSRNQWSELRAHRTPNSVKTPLDTMNMSTRPTFLVCHWLCFICFWTLCKWAHIVYVLLHVAFFLLNIKFMSSVHAVCEVVTCLCHWVGMYMLSCV